MKKNSFSMDFSLRRRAGCPRYGQMRLPWCSPILGRNPKGLFLGFLNVPPLGAAASIRENRISYHWWGVWRKEGGERKGAFDNKSHAGQTRLTTN
jgi:hypothetical protein